MFGRYGTDIITPKDDFTSYYFWGVTRGYKVGDPAIDEFWRISIKAAFEGQDEPIIEAQQQMLGGQSLEEALPVMISVDAASTRVRRVLARLIGSLFFYFLVIEYSGTLVFTTKLQSHDRPPY